MRETLTRLGFDVDFHSNVQSLHEFQYEILPNFRSKIVPGSFVVFYFSGHGFSLGRDNLLAPTSIPLQILADDVSDSAISVESLQDLIATHLPGVIVFFIDACSSIGGFVVSDSSGSNIVQKGPSDPRGVSQFANSFVAFASRPGYPAIGSSNPGSLSVFTESLLLHIEDPGQPLGTIFKDVAANVNTVTHSKQDPGVYDWSKTDPYFKRNDAVRNQEKEVWQAALSKSDFNLISNFSLRHADTVYAAASRKWLQDNRGTRYNHYSLASPLAIERAWSANVSERVRVLRTGGPFAFSRFLNSEAAEGSLTKSDHDIGVIDPLDTLPLFTRNLTSLRSHDQLLLTQNLKAKALNTGTVNSFELVPKGTLLEVEGIDVINNRVTISANYFQGQKTLIFDLGTWVTPEPLDLGYSIKEIVVPPRLNAMQDLADPEAIRQILKEFKTQGHKISWVSLSTSKTDDKAEEALRDSRMSDAEFLLKQEGISSQRITSVSGLEDFEGPGVALDFLV